MGFNCGIVGMPNVGKSTLFNALTRAGIDAENFPFCTIDPNTGVVPVPDPHRPRPTLELRSEALLVALKVVTVLRVLRCSAAAISRAAHR